MKGDDDGDDDDDDDDFGDNGDYDCDSRNLNS